MREMPTFWTTALFPSSRGRSVPRKNLHICRTKDVTSLKTVMRTPVSELHFLRPASAGNSTSVDRTYFKTPCVVYPKRRELVQKVRKAALPNMQVFWEITLYRSEFPDVSRYRSAFIFRIKQL